MFEAFVRILAGEAERAKVDQGEVRVRALRRRGRRRVP